MLLRGQHAVLEDRQVGGDVVDLSLHGSREVVEGSEDLLSFALQILGYIVFSHLTNLHAHHLIRTDLYREDLHFEEPWALVFPEDEGLHLPSLEQRFGLGRRGPVPLFLLDGVEQEVKSLVLLVGLAERLLHQLHVVVLVAVAFSGLVLFYLTLLVVSGRLVFAFADLGVDL